MWFLKLYRLFCGYVQFTASGGFSERFLNLCGKNSINLWALEAESGRVTACTSAKDYRRIRRCAVCSGMVTKINEKRGFPFFLQKYRKRIGLLYGAAFAVCFFAVMSTMVWSIEISGNNRVTDSQIIEALAQAGVKYGTLKKNIDAASTRFFVMEKLPDISYITVNVIGSCIQAKVTEQSLGVSQYSSEVPCDIVSKVDGQIAVLDVYHGTKLYKTGEAVRKGDVLAGGFIELSYGGIKFKHAEAYALIRTNLDFSAVTNAQTENFVKQDEKKKYTLHFLRFDIPFFGKAEGEPVLTRNRSLIFGNTYLPFGITCQTYRVYKKENRILSEEELALTAAENYLHKKIQMLDGAYICSQQIKKEKDSSGISIFAEVLGEVSAGVARECLIEENATY